MIRDATAAEARVQHGQAEETGKERDGGMIDLQSRGVMSHSSTDPDLTDVPEAWDDELPPRRWPVVLPVLAIVLLIMAVWQGRNGVRAYREGVRVGSSYWARNFGHWSHDSFRGWELRRTGFVRCRRAMVLAAVGGIASIGFFVVVGQFRAFSIGVGILSLLTAGGNFVVLGWLLWFWGRRNIPAPTWLW